MKFKTIDGYIIDFIFEICVLKLFLLKLMTIFNFNIFKNKKIKTNFSHGEKLLIFKKINVLLLLLLLVKIKKKKLKRVNIWYQNIGGNKKIC